MEPPQLNVLMTCMPYGRLETGLVDSSPLTITSRMHTEVTVLPVESKALNEVAVGGPLSENKRAAVATVPLKRSASAKGRQASIAAQAAAKLLSPPRRLTKSRRPQAASRAASAIFSKRKCITAELLASAGKKEAVEGCGADIV